MGFISSPLSTRALVYLQRSSVMGVTKYQVTLLQSHELVQTLVFVHCIEVRNDAFPIHGCLAEHTAVSVCSSPVRMSMYDMIFPTSAVHLPTATANFSIGRVFGAMVEIVVRRAGAPISFQCALGGITGLCVVDFHFWRNAASERRRDDVVSTGFTHLPYHALQILPFAALRKHFHFHFQSIASHGSLFRAFSFTEPLYHTTLHQYFTPPSPRIRNPHRQRTAPPTPRDHGTQFQGSNHPWRD